MAYDLEEQEQLENIKGWWQQYGKIIVTAVTVVALAFAALQGWRYYQGQQALQAVTLYEQLERAERANETKKINDIAVQIVERYRSTPYAAMAALAGAKASFAMNDLASTNKHLRWVVEHARDEAMRDVARLRLAGLLLDEKQYAEALKLLEAKHDPIFDGFYADLRGDVLAAEGKVEDARRAYRVAQEKVDPDSPYAQMLSVKLDALGEAAK